MVLSEFDPLWLLIIGILVGICFASAVWAWRYNVKIRAAFEKGLTQDAEKNTAERRLLDERLDIRIREMTRLEARIELLQSQATEQNKVLDERTSLLSAQQASEAALQARLEETKKAFVEKEAL